MDSRKKNRNNYGRVMSRVFNRSRSSLRSSSSVRQEVPSSVRVGAKPSVSVPAVASGVFSELPKVLNDYVPEVERENVVQRRSVRPRRTLKSLDPAKAKSPPRTSRDRAIEYSRNVRARESAPAVLDSNGEEWSEAHVRQCHSSRSHTRLQELKDEIKAFSETDKLLKLRSHLYKSCGVVLDDFGRVSKDRAVQVDPLSDKDSTPIRRFDWLRLISREDLSHKSPYHYRICEEHFKEDDILPGTHRKMLKSIALPSQKLPILRKKDKETQTIVVPQACQFVQTAIYCASKPTQTPAYMSVDRKRKLESDRLECRKKLKMSETGVQTENVEIDTFHKLCDKFLTEELATFVKAQTLHMNEVFLCNTTEQQGTSNSSSQ